MNIDYTPQPAELARRSLHEALRGQEGHRRAGRMLERLLVAILTGGHVLLEGVPGLAKTLTVKTLSQAVGGSFGRIQFTPDLVPSDVVSTGRSARSWRRRPSSAR